jgi:hypothetical protein
VEGDWLQRQHGFARFVHRFNLLFKPTRGKGRAKLATGVDQYWQGIAAYERRENVADKAAIAQVRSGMTKTNNVIGRFDADASSNAYGSVEAAGGVVSERNITNGGVTVSFRVTKEREKTVRCVGGSGGIAEEGFETHGRVATSRGILIERVKAVSRVLDAARVADRILMVVQLGRLAKT